MESVDPQKANRVWQRVQGGFNAEDLIPLAAMEAGDAVVLNQLSQRFSGKDAVLLRQLSAQANSCSACLRGMYQLRTDHYLPQTSAADPAGENTQAVLRRCYGKALQRIASYEAQTGEPQFGFVFAQLAQQKKEVCQALLTLLGNLKF